MERRTAEAARARHTNQLRKQWRDEEGQRQRMQMQTRVKRARYPPRATPTLATPSLATPRSRHRPPQHAMPCPRPGLLATPCAAPLLDPMRYPWPWPSLPETWPQRWPWP